MVRPHPLRVVLHDELGIDLVARLEDAACAALVPGRVPAAVHRVEDSVFDPEENVARHVGRVLILQPDEVHGTKRVHCQIPRVLGARCGAEANRKRDKRGKQP